MLHMNPLCMYPSFVISAASLLLAQMPWSAQLRLQHPQPAPSLLLPPFMSTLFTSMYWL